MFAETLTAIFTRDLQKLKSEIEAYQHEDIIWITGKSIANSAGNLCLHLIGNLNTYIGAELGKTGYIRHRDLEFSLKDIERPELIRRIDQTIDVVSSSLALLEDRTLDEDYPLLVFDQKKSMAYMLIHLATHLSYHLGQINYHRRLLDSK